MSLNLYRSYLNCSSTQSKYTPTVEKVVLNEARGKPWLRKYQTAVLQNHPAIKRRNPSIVFALNQSLPVRPGRHRP